MAIGSVVLVVGFITLYIVKKRSRTNKNPPSNYIEHNRNFLNNNYINGKCINHTKYKDNFDYIEMSEEGYNDSINDYEQPRDGDFETYSIIYDNLPVYDNNANLPVYDIVSELPNLPVYDNNPLSS